MQPNEELALVITIIASVSALLSACTAGVSLFLAYRQHEWNKKNHLASVKPYLSDGTDTNLDPLGFSYIVSNNGLGPALIEEFVIKWDTKPITMLDLKGRLAQQLGPYFKIVTCQFGEPHAMKVNEDVHILDIQYTGDQMSLCANPKGELDSIVNSLMLNCRIEIKYKSFLSDDIQTFKTTILESVAAEKGIVVTE